MKLEQKGDPAANKFRSWKQQLSKIAKKKSHKPSQSPHQSFPSPEDAQMKLEQKGDPAVAERNETKREKGDLKNSAHKSVDVPCSTDSRRQAASNKTKPLKPKMSKEGPDVQQEEHVANELNTFSGSAQKAETDSDENLNG